MKKIAVIRIRGGINTSVKVEDTLKMLNLERKNSCVIIESTPSIIGMIAKAKDYITWGEVDGDAEKALEARGRGKKTVRLNPPKGGFGRKGIKKQFSAGGAIGARKEKINELIRRML